ncbi:MAG: hypothetical protein ACOC83_06700 [Gemmatimonadota bacterium]
MARGTYLVGRVLFAVALVGFGVLCLVFGDTVHQLQPMDVLLSESTPMYGVLALATGAFLVVAGLAIAGDVAPHPLATALTAFLALWIAVLQVPSAFVDPGLLRSPWWVRTFETLALTGGSLVVAGRTSRPERERWIRVGRLLFGVSLPVFGVLHFVYAESTASLVPDFYPWPLIWIYVTGLGNVAAGVAIATGVLSRLAAVLAGAMYGVYALTLHSPRAASTYIPQLLAGDPAVLQDSRAGLTSLFVAVGMWGVAWIVAGSTPRRSPGGAVPDRPGGETEVSEPEDPP